MALVAKNRKVKEKIITLLNEKKNLNRKNRELKENPRANHIRDVMISNTITNDMSVNIA